MGITIHYQGKLNQPDLAEEFCEELEDIAKAMEWKYYLISSMQKWTNWLGCLKPLKLIKKTQQNPSLTKLKSLSKRKCKVLSTG
jgi:hypothetical protein